jgi:hypothetical protein
VTPRVKTMYTIECYTQNKKVAFASCVIPGAIQSTINRPQLKLEISTESVRRGGHVHVTWSAYKVKQCVVSGQGISEKGPVGSVDTESLLIRGRSRIQLRCKALDDSEVHIEKEVYVE